MRATKVNAGLAESNGRLLLGIWRDSLHVTCDLTACTPGSAPGPTLGNEYGKTLPFTLQRVQILAILHLSAISLSYLLHLIFLFQQAMQTTHAHRFRAYATLVLDYQKTALDTGSTLDHTRSTGDET